MATPTIALPAAPPPDPSEPLPELPPELLLAFLQTQHQSDETRERDALEAFALGGAGQGGVQLEDILNELLPDGAQALIVSMKRREELMI